jgi:putative copper resistance protein D
VTQLLDIFALLSVLLRGMTLAFEALTVGGVIFLLAIAKQAAGAPLTGRLSRLLIRSSALLAVTQISFIAANSAILMGSSDLAWREIRGAGFCIAGAMMVVGAVMVGLFTSTRFAKAVTPIGSGLILAGAVMTSHSVARLEHRWELAAFTLAHHIATAAWIGGMPYLLLSFRQAPDRAAVVAITNRFSRMAMISVAVLASAGLALGLLYIGSTAALVGTTYGIMLLSKIMLTCMILVLGGLNFSIVRKVRRGSEASLFRVCRLAEAEAIIGFTVLLAAASLTSTPPAIDVQADRVTTPEISERMKARWPRMRSPSTQELSPATPLAPAPNSTQPGSFVPGQLVQPNTPADIAWSEYNHHWAGVLVLAIGILSLLGRRISWARNWPLAFFGLAIFLLVRADSENWPLGPRGFWESFQVAEVAQHRLFVLLIAAFALFEWAVQTGRVALKRAGLVFPVVCAAGGALLLTHSHSLGNVKEEFLAELSHAPLAILAVTAGWTRWLEVRLAPDRLSLVQWIWPGCFVVIGAILMNYREG